MLEALVHRGSDGNIVETDPASARATQSTAADMNLNAFPLGPTATSESRARPGPHGLLDRRASRLAERRHRRYVYFRN